MTAPTFKIGDRVMTRTWGPATVVQVDEDEDVMPYMVRFDPDGDMAPWTMWYDASDLTLALTPTPMSPEAKMVWHAMRAGAKRTARIHITSMDGTCYRVRQYMCHNSIALRVEMKLPPLAEDEAQS